LDICLHNGALQRKLSLRSLHNHIELRTGALMFTDHTGTSAQFARMKLWKIMKSEL
jgi:hypothetical protein